MTTNTYERGRRARTIAARLTAAGVTPPAGIARAVAIDDALHAATTTAEASLDPVAAGITDGTLTPAKAGKLLTDAALARSTADYAKAAHRDLSRSLDTAAAAGLAEDADRVLAELRPTFDAAAAELVAAHEVLGDDPDAHRRTHTATVAGARALEQRDAALSTLRRIDRVRHDLADVHPAYRTSAAFWYVTGATTTPKAPARWWDLIAAGYQLHLNTPTEADAVAAAVAQADAEREAARLRHLAERPDNRRAARRADRELAARAALAGGDAA